MIEVVLILITVVDAVSLLESILACWHFRHRKDAISLPLDRYPSATALICAYLPNEEAIILDTVKHFLDHLDYPGELKILLVYNSEAELPVLGDLQLLAKKRSSFSFIQAPNSTRKAANIRYALGYIDTPIVGLFDADSRPVSTCFTRAAAWLSCGNHFVQGATIVRTLRGTFLAQVVAVEVILKYFVAYSARYCYWRSTYFSGSNGYWLTEALARVPPRDSAQVEDIDMSIRLLLGGGQLAFDPEILAYDEAPPTFSSWWRQRVRWAQGWAQLVRWHLNALVRAAILKRVKLLWCYFLVWRRIVVPLSLATLGLLLCFGYEYSLLLVTIIFGVRLMLQLIGTSVASSVALGLTTSEESYPKYYHFVMYVVLFPLYDALRTFTVIRGSVGLFKDPTKWHCTPRDYKQR